MSELYDIYNPTQARRVIYDGVAGQQRRIQVDPGQMKRGVELEDHIALRYGDGRDGFRGDLWVTPTAPDLANPFQQIRPAAPQTIDDGPVICPHCGKDIHAPPIAEAQEANAELDTAVEDVPAPQTEYDVATDEQPPTTVAPSASLPQTYERYQAPPIFNQPAAPEPPKQKRKYTKRKKAKKVKRGRRRASEPTEVESAPGELDAA